MKQYSATDAEQILAEIARRGLFPDDVTRADLLKTYAKVEYHLDILAPMLPEVQFQPSNAILVTAPLVAVIVETRQHFNLVRCVLQVHHQLGVPIQIFHSPENHKFIMDSKLNPLIETGEIVLTEIVTAPLRAKVYNRMFLRKSFWEQTIGRKKILIFQTDATINARSKLKIGDFLNFDYIGSTWPRNNWTGMIVDGGNGGLSLRDWPLTMATLDRFPVNETAWSEDIFFAFHIELIGGKIGKPDDCARFSMQDKFITHSFGAHKLQFMSPIDRLRVLFINPSAWRILPHVSNIRKRWTRLKLKILVAMGLNSP